MKFLHRIWTGIVASVAGAAIALVLQIAGTITIGLPIDYLLWMVLGCSGIGFVLGVLIGPRTIVK